jgi:hypothetical protein
MKKLLSYIISGGLGILLWSSCSKDFMERYPTASVSPPTFFNTEADLKAYTNLFYTYLPDATAIYGESADNIVKSSLDQQVSGTRIVPLRDATRWNWEPLRSINFLLNSENVQKFNDVAIRERYLGLARFFRAWFYFEKVQNFGDVPWYSIVIETNDIENQMKARDPRTLVMDSVLADINYAIDKLGTEKNVERVTRWTALALKARICLYEGTWRKYHTSMNLPNADLFLTEAANAAATLINESGYTVYKKTSGPSGLPYQDLFATLKLDGVADEVIMGRRYSNELNLKHGLQFYMTARTQGKPGLEKQLINSYLMADGSRFTDIPGYDTITFYNEVQNRDPRLAQTIRTPGYRRIGQTQLLPPDFESSMTGYQPIKWMNATTYDGNGQSINEMLYFRLGEALLVYAEAKAELGTLTQNDLDISLNKLRDRVNMPPLNMANANAHPDSYLEALYPNVTGSNKGVILEIRRERRIELVMENGTRWDDLMRWKAGHLVTRPFLGMYFPGPGFYDLDRNGVNDVEIYSGAKPPLTGPYQMPLTDLTSSSGGNIWIHQNIVKRFDESKDYLWPLPIEDLNLNKNLVQNPNWK